jgi:hypothetical protein
MGQEHWYLRDSNWDPDFSKSGLQAAWFYEKEMNIKVDGVVGISLPLVTRLLEVTGPLELPDFNERISSTNFFVKSLLYTQTDFFPGSTQKKDFLGSLTNALMLRLTTDRSLSSAKLFSAIASSLDGRDAQFYFYDPRVEGIVSQWGWAGKAEFPPCQPMLKDVSSCTSDGVALVEANVGVNKANYFVKQEGVTRVNIEENGDIRQESTITLKNTSSNQGHDGGGDYQSYVRLLYPEDTELVSVKIDGQELSIRDQTKKNATISSVFVDRIGSIVSVGFPVSVVSHGQRQVSISTIRKAAFQTQASGVYQYTLRKQAGVDSIPWHVSVEYPDAWGVNSDLELAKPGVLEYNTDLVRDGRINILFNTSL